ncbi:MAG: hypothetical protein ACRELA_25470 [Candidatus Rokuibacteriota bacterium]
MAHPVIHARVAGGLWLKVEVLDGVRDDPPERLVARGWVPARSRGGTALVWLFARGC